MFKVILLILSIKRSATQSGCAEGCLKCTSENECELCDNLKNYKLAGSQCLKAELENCKKIDLSGNCTECEEHYFIEENLGKCIAVDTDKKIENCYRYDEKQICVFCGKGHYFSKGKCEVVQEVVANCEIYNNDQTCSECAGGYLIGSDKKCHKTAEGCIFYGEVDCQECESGYLLNRNLFFSSLFNFASSSSKLELGNLIQDLSVESYSLKSFDICESINLTNCKLALSSIECKECNSGYHVSDGVCVSNPVPLITDCKIYQNATTCRVCNDNFYLKNNLCNPIKEISNCALYDSSADYSLCLECSEGFFLQANSCLSRNLSIQGKISNCQTPNKYLDRCANCLDSFVLSQDGLACLKEIPNCQAYQIFYHTTLALTCIDCNDTFILQENSCQEGGIQFCKKYLSSTLCLECTNGYYLANQNKECKAHKLLADCESYSQSEKDYCVKCTNQKFNFFISSQCKEYTRLQNCTQIKVQDEKVTCEKCVEGFVPNAEGQCTSIQVERCVLSSKVDECEKCQGGYVIQGDKKACILPFSFISENCDEISGTSIDDVKCSDCFEKTLPLQLKDNFVCVEDSLMGKIDSNITAVTDCLKYKASNCVQCTSNKFLQSDDTCDTACAQFYVRNEVFKDGNSKLQILGTNVCKTSAEAHMANCLVGAYNMNSPASLELVCLKCKPDQLQFFDPSLEGFSNVDPNQAAPPYIPSPVFLSHQIKCISKADNSDKVITDCKYYFSGRVNPECLTCEFGKTGILSASNSIEKCESMLTLENNSCQDKVIQNAHPYWQTIFSCYQCNNSAQIPVLFIESTTNNVQKFKSYDITKTDWQGTTEKSTIKCVNKNAAGFGYTVENQTSFTLDQNCGLAVVNTSVQKDQINGAVKPVYCAACAPQYKPADASLKMVSGCTFIPSCVGKEWFNSCSQCQQGYIYKYNTDSKKVLFDECLLFSSVANCYAGIPSTNTESEKCAICKRGYNKNADGFCVIYKPAKCISSSAFSQTVLANNYEEFKFTSYKGQEGTGCSECVSSYKAIFFDTTLSNKYVFGCVYSQHLVDNFDKFSLTSAFIKFCTHYFYHQSDGRYKCSRCSEETTLNSTQTLCVENVNNCQVATDEAGKCKKCIEGYMLVNEKCVRGTVDFCQKYDLETETTSGICLKCEAGYFLKEQKCFKGEVQFCQEYQEGSGNICLKCQENYGLVVRSYKHYCLAIPSTLNCVAGLFLDSIVYGGKFQCTQCKDWNFKIVERVSDDQENTLCLPFNSINECKKYDIGHSLGHSTFDCLECGEGFYLKESNKCEARTLDYSNNCAEFQVSADFCKVCKEGYFLSDDKKQCVAFPSGIRGCFQYADNENCLLCQTNKFLENNKCIDIALINQITNCLYYETGTKCKECKPNYFLKGEECVETVAQNCKEYASEKECSDCPTGYGLEEKDGVVSCKEMTIQNCIKFEIKTPYNCIQCKPNFYPSNGLCKEMTEEIANCEISQNEDVCLKCKVNTALTEDGSACLNTTEIVNQIPRFCASAVKKNDHFCTVCKPGYYFNQQICEACKTEQCFACEPLNPDKCVVCNSGYYMNSQGQCIINGSTNTTPDNTTNTDSTGKVLILKSLLAYFFVLQIN